MKKEQTRYIVKRNYNASRTGADAFIKLIKKDKSKYENIKDKGTGNENINIEYTQYNIDNDNNVCYTKDSFRESCVIPKNPKEE